MRGGYPGVYQGYERRIPWCICPYTLGGYIPGCTYAQYTTLGTPSCTTPPSSSLLAGCTLPGEEALGSTWENSLGENLSRP